MDASKAISEDELVNLLGDVGEGERRVVAIAGPPGSGKSTLAENLEARLNARIAGYAAILAMDGFHYDDQVLIPRGLRAKKGAPETFDIDGFAHMLKRLGANASREIAVPVFDRSLEIARAGARVIPQSVRLLIVEGNYLLLGRDSWESLQFETTIMLEVSRDTLRQRLVNRWAHYGKSPEEIALQVDGNDMVNVDLVQMSSRRANFLVRER
ncbi:MAG: nucleoside triphosphate hydrolase [Rhizobium sp.]|nr:MAG: nucleoside triphosphate hydrolase [Rhizobium sp.]